MLAILTFAAGVVLGLLGGGGSMLVVPILLQVGHVPPHQAIAASLAAVGLGAIVGFIRHARKGNVDWRIGAYFVLGGMAGGWIGGHLARFVPGSWLVTGFALLMLLAAGWMLLDTRPRPPGQPAHAIWMTAASLLVGAITGLVGAGGGFAVVPALVLLGGIPMRRAIGTSLLVIAVQAGAGLAGHLSHARLDGSLLLVVSAATALGSVLGARLTGRLKTRWLRRGFAAMAAAIAVWMLAYQWFGAAPAWSPSSAWMGDQPLTARRLESGMPRAP